MPEESTLSRNFLLQLFAQLCNKLGDALMNPKVTLPWLLQSLGVPAWFLGWLVPLRESGSMLPQLWLASWVRRMPLRKGLWVAGCWVQALAVGGMALVAWQGGGVLAGWLVLGLLVVFSLARALCSMASKDVMGKTIAKSRRGSLSGWASSGAGVITLLLALALLLLPAGPLDGVWYALGLALAALLWLLAGALYLPVDEPHEAAQAGEGAHSVLARLDLLRTQPQLRRFILIRSLLLCSALTAPFYVALAAEHMGDSLQVLALMLAASGAAGLLSGPFWGRLADGSSRQVLIRAALLTAGVGLLTCGVSLWQAEWLASSWLLPLVYLLLSVAHEGVRIGRKTYLVNMAEGNQRTDFVALSNTLIALLLLAFGALGSLTVLVGSLGVILLLSLLGVAGALLARSLPEVEREFSALPAAAGGQ